MNRPLPESVLSLAILLVCAQSFAREKPEVWLEIRSPHFRVATDGSEKQGRRVADEFERIRSVFHTIFPAQTVDPPAPITVIAARDEKGFSQLLPGALTARGAARPSGLFQRGPEKIYVLLRLDAPGENPFHPLYHEYTHVLLSQNPMPLPPWLDEGIAEYYGNSQIQEKQVLLGRADESHLRLLREARLLPLATLFGVTHTSPFYNESNKASIFYAESWALVHMLITESYGQQRNPLKEYLHNLDLKMDPQAAALRAFGDLSMLQKQLESYLTGTTFKFFAVKTETPIDEQSFALREMTPSEADAVRGDFLVYNENFGAARIVLSRALQEDPRNAQAAESMGFLEFQQDHPEEARKWFARAIQLDSKSYLARYYYATMRMQESPAAVEDEDVSASLRQAIQINPQFAPAYNSLALLYSSRGKDLEEARALALRAVSLEPANTYYYLTAANILLRLEQAANAIRVCEKAIATARNPTELTSAQNMLESAQRYQAYLEKTRGEPVPGKETRQAVSKSGPGASSSTGKDAVTPPVLRERGESSDAPSQDAASNAPISFHSDPAQRGARDTLTGTIQEVKCALPALMQLTLVAGSQTVQLFSENLYNVQYSALDFSPAGELRPCQDLKGKKAQVFFYDLKGRPSKGELISVQLRK